MGCIASGVDVQIVRLTYETGIAGMRMLIPAELKNLIRDPLLRSTDALSGLFHRGVIVGESDHDRAFYEEINRRLVDVDRGTADTFFTNAHPSYKKVGISRLNSTQRRKAKRLFKDLAAYGVFVVEVGELEGWLSSLKLSTGRGKGGWIVNAFKKLGANPDAQTYAAPGKADVWAFMDKVGAWVNDPARKGLPE